MAMLQPHFDARGDDSPITRSAADWQPPWTVRALGVVVAIVAISGDLVAVGIAFGGFRGPGTSFYLMYVALTFITSAVVGPPSPLLYLMCAAWFTSGFGLLTVWLGLGGGRLYVRLLVMGMISAILVLVVGKGHWSAGAFALSVLFPAAGAAPFGLLYIMGFELASAADARASGGGGAALGRGQFSLRQLFGWTVAATLVASLARFATISPGDAVLFGVWAATFSLISIGAVFATLLPGGPEAVVLRAVMLYPAAVLAAGFAAALLVGAARAGINVEGIWHLAFTMLMHVLLMGLVLLLYRRLGYRLRRRESLAEIATTSKPSAS
jgi:hypothetical protein